MLTQYDQARPGTADLLVRWSEEEQAHRRKMEALALQANIDAQQKQVQTMDRQVAIQREVALYQAATVRRSDFAGQALGWLICTMAIGGAIWLGLAGHTVVAGLLAAIPTAAIVQSFRTLTRQDAKAPPASDRRGP